MKKILKPAIIAIIILPILIGIAPRPAASGSENFSIYWLPFGEALRYAQENNTLIFAYVYTDWCSQCKKMNNRTFTDPTLQYYLSEKFVCTRINAESSTEHECNGQRYSEQQIAQMLGVNGYPTIVMLASRGGGNLGSFSGYREPNELQEILTYYGDGHFLQMPFNKWRKQR